MNIVEIVLLFLAGLASGAINAVAGGGTFIAFGALTLVGLPPITANATSSIAQFPGYLTSALAYRRELAGEMRALVPMILVSLVGGAIGAFALLALENAEFRRLVPWLLIGATTLFAAGPRITAAMNRRALRVPRVVGWFVQFVVGVYGGFFGGGMGIMILAALGMTEGTADFHRLNAIKTFLSAVVATVALVIFSNSDAVSWPAAVVMILAVAIGGWGGVQLARRVPNAAIRLFVVTIGVVLTIYYALT